MFKTIKLIRLKKIWILYDSYIGLWIWKQKNISNAPNQINIPNIVSNDPKLNSKIDSFNFSWSRFLWCSYENNKEKKFWMQFIKLTRIKKMLGICLANAVIFWRKVKNREVLMVSKFLKGKVEKIKKI